jgi:RND family efflux transporter MFP subunit
MTCPSREILLQYSLGLVSEEQSKDLAGHLDACPDCQATIMTLDDADDTLIGRLRTPLSGESVLAEPQLDDALAAAMAMPFPMPIAEEGSSLARRSSSGMPEMLGEYRVLEQLGRGGMGRVYKALHTKLDRVVAVKVLPRGRVGDQKAIVRFEREMKAVGGLEHPNIVHAHDAREIDGAPVLIMEYVDGLDLAEIVRHVGPLPTADACELVRQTALALQCAHEHGLVHRDIKPSNIMLARSGEVKLLDLGLARFCAEASVGEETTGTGQAMGTADYMAPEQTSDSRTVDIRADIYGLGATLYKLLSGRAPFSGPEHQGTFEKMQAHRQSPLPPIGQFCPTIPHGLAGVLDRMLAKDPADRYSTPTEAAEALAPFCIGSDLPALLRRAESSISSPLPPGKGQGKGRALSVPLPAAHRWRTIVAALVALLLVGGLGFAFGIIYIRIHDKNGQVTTVGVAAGSNADVNAKGDVDVTPPGGTSEGKAPQNADLTFEIAKVAGELAAQQALLKNVDKMEIPVLELEALAANDPVTKKLLDDLETYNGAEIQAIAVNSDHKLADRLKGEVAKLQKQYDQRLVALPKMAREKQRSAIEKEIVKLNAHLAALRQQQGEPQEAAAFDAKAIQGTWEVVSSTLNLIKKLPDQEDIAPEKVFKSTKIVIAGDTFKVMGDHVITMAFEYKLNPAAKTKIIDLQTPGDMGLISWGIYKLEGNQLTICASGIPARLDASQPSEDVNGHRLMLTSRPTEFWAEPGSGKDLLVLRRIGDAVVAEDEKAIEGTWRVESVSQFTCVFHMDAPGSERVVFSRRGMTVGANPSNQPSLTIGYALNPTGSPKRIDFANVTDPPMTSVCGIYELHGDRLTMCFSSGEASGMGGSPRLPPPTKLAATPETAIAVLKRISKPSRGKTKSATLKPIPPEAAAALNWVKDGFHAAVESHKKGDDAALLQANNRTAAKIKELHALLEGTTAEKPWAEQAELLRAYQKATIEHDEDRIPVLESAIREWDSGAKGRSFLNLLSFSCPMRTWDETRNCVVVHGTRTWHETRNGVVAQSEKPKEPSLQFGPVIERVVNARSEGKGSDAIDLAGGKLVDLPKDFDKRPTDKQGKWCAENNVDLFVDGARMPAAKEGYPAVLSACELAPEGLKLAAVVNERWDSLTDENLHSALTSITPGEAVGVFMPVAELHERGGTTYYDIQSALPATFAFQTRKGDLGLLQVLRYTEEPRGMRIRYKLARPPAANAPGAVVTPTADLKALQGPWKVVRVEKGKDADESWARILGFGAGSENPAAANRFDFSEGRLAVLSFAEAQTWQSDYGIDPTTAIKTIDILEDHDGKQTGPLLGLGIYDRDGDRLEICLSRYVPSLKTDQRPKRFAVEPNSADVLFTLERIRPSEDEKTIAGNWTVAAETDDGKPLADEKRRDLGWQIGDNSFMSYYSSKDATRTPHGTMSGVYRLEADKQPKRITFFAQLMSEGFKRQDFQGIYKFEGDRLTIAYCKGDKPPEKFESKPGSGIALLVLERPTSPTGAQSGRGGRRGRGAPSTRAEPVMFRTATVTRGDITATIGANGTIEPAEVLDVGAQVAGQIVSLGIDPRAATDPNFKDKKIDYNSPVEVGTVLAKIDPTVYAARHEQEKAGLRRARAELQLAEAKAKQQTPEVAKASLEAAEATVQQSQSALAVARTNLDYTVITSPVKGVIIDRRVNVGQNVAPAGPNAPSLFLIAKDLKKMQIWASVNEADVARIRKGMEVRFTVDAFPKETFKGTVSQIRLNAAMVQNVVSYTVVIAFENPDLKLVPYLTANVQFQVEKRKNVLRVPNAALRWKPVPDLVGSNAAASEAQGANRSLSPGPALWIKTPDGQHVQRIPINVGLSDGLLSEVSGPDVKEGMKVVIGEVFAGQDSGDVTNAVVPRIRPARTALGR